MIFNRRSLLKMGLAGSLVPLGSELAKAGENSAFEAWRRDFVKSVPPRMAEARVAGTAVAIASRDSAPYAAAFGFADVKRERRLTVNTPMHLASISKLVTAAALVQLFERRNLDLHADVAGFIDFPVRNPNHPKLPVTPFQLITHTSSISDEGYDDSLSTSGDPTQSLGDFLRDYLLPGGRLYAPDKSFLKAKPGKKWDYCNVAMALAGYVVEKVSRRRFSSYTEANLFEPLRLRDAHWYLRDFPANVLAKPYRFGNGGFVEMPQEGYPDVPAGMLRCPVSGLARILKAMLGGTTGQRRILSQHAVTEMLRRQVDPALVSYQGLGWVAEEINGREYVGHSGLDAGATNMVVLTPDQRHAVIVLMNIEKTAKNDKFRSAMTEDLLAGAKLIR